MKETPLLMRGPLVLQTLAGLKSQTRRINGLEELNRYPGSLSGSGAACDLGYKGLCPSAYYIKDKAAYRKNPGAFHYFVGESDRSINIIPLKCPYGGIGDRLWVKENAYITPKRWADRASDCNARDADGDPRIVGYASSMDGESVRCAEDYKVKLSPSIFMPRWASRLTLEIVEVRVERVQDISEEDARAEGCDGNCPIGYIPAHQKAPCTYHFAQLWDSINATRGHGWEKNDWVWVVVFKLLP